ncbi:hypothetical protein N7373_05515 [Achromobacter mucicolens]|uniref:hypothetical protein n=1 Tax=Achromobacter mucicolens TaxID=1389922 RepID=UPI00244B2222|nr:hypothetical protein [Achromobacter mucicolens]MDH0090899.1 hypothetical protein [Achromobacter mucicolens]
MTICSACIRTLSCLALSFFPLITSAQIPAFGAWPLPLPPLPAPADLVNIQLAHQTWSSDDGQDWIILTEQRNSIAVYLSRQACERWLAQGKLRELSALTINSEPTHRARCHDGVNKADHPAPHLSAKAFETLLFSSLLD